MQNIVCLLIVVQVQKLFGNRVPTSNNNYQIRQDYSWCGNSAPAILPGLDDPNCEKVFPEYFDREFVCPNQWDAEYLQDFSDPELDISKIQVNDQILADILPFESNAAVGIIRRSPGVNKSNYKIKWLGKNSTEPYETWSSSKVFAGSRTAQTLRSMSSNFAGLDSIELGTYQHLLADLITIICSYDLNFDLTSNQLGSYFHQIAGHQNATKFIQNYLGASAEEKFGGEYGEVVPNFLAFNFTNGTNFNQILTNPEWPDTTISANYMSALTTAEYLRQIIMTREDQNLNLLNWEDSKMMMYGAEKSQLFPGLQFGGLSQSTDIYQQLAVNMTEINARSLGNWRIFSKLGFGYTFQRYQFEDTLVGYSCYPVVDKNGQPVKNRGLEFVFSTRVYDKPNRTDLLGFGADEKQRQVMSAISEYLLENYDGKSSSQILSVSTRTSKQVR